jgi:hypothetical protein
MSLELPEFCHCIKCYGRCNTAFKRVGFIETSFDMLRSSSILLAKTVDVVLVLHSYDRCATSFDKLKSIKLGM